MSREGGTKRPASKGASGPGASRIDTLPEGFAEVLKKRSLEVGAVIGGKYKLTEALGEGGMGQVFVADNIAIGLHVAVKVLKPDLLANPEFRHRFQQEAQAVAAIEHPNVARFFDLVVGDPTFLVMEYIRGPTLDEVLERDKRLAPARAVAIARRIAWGLDAAHAVKVVHRDMKPANVVLAPDREHGEMPKVIDFGLAKLAATASQGGLTRTGQIVGTPHYMAPEQIEGRAVDARTDVYALGCLLYHLLTGRPPFADVEEDVQILYRQLHDAPKPPSSLAPEVPATLDAVLTKALAKAPASRFATMSELAKALDAAIAPLPAPAVTPPSDAAGAAPAAPRSAILVLGAAAVLLVGMVGGVLAARSVATDDEPAPVVAAKPVTTGSIMLLTEPAAAAVEVDGQRWPETTPTTITGLAAGEHAVKIIRDGNMTLERTVTLADGQRLGMNVVLQAASRSVQVRTIPSGALIYLNDRLVAAASPTTISISEEDFHEVRAEKIGYEPAIVHLAPEDREPEVTIALDVEKAPRGYIAVDADTIAAVYIDGTETGFETPTLGIRVPVGAHTVEIVDGTGRRSATEKVNVQQGQTVRLKLAVGAGPP